MWLIESFLNGKLIRQHWHALCNSDSEAQKKIEWMRQTFEGISYQTREVMQSVDSNLLTPTVSRKPRRRWAHDYDGGLPAV